MTEIARQHANKVAQELFGDHASLKGDKAFFVVLSLEECVGFEWVKVRDVNGDFTVLDLFGCAGCSVGDSSHHEPTNNGPSS